MYAKNTKRVEANIPAERERVCRRGADAGGFARSDDDAITYKDIAIRNRTLRNGYEQIKITIK